MSQAKLKDCKIAVLATDEFEQSELEDPGRLLEEAGAQLTVIAPGDVNEITGWQKKTEAGKFPSTNGSSRQMPMFGTPAQNGRTGKW